MKVGCKCSRSRHFWSKLCTFLSWLPGYRPTLDFGLSTYSRNKTVKLSLLCHYQLIFQWRRRCLLHDIFRFLALCISVCTGEFESREDVLSETNVWHRLGSLYIYVNIVLWSQMRREAFENIWRLKRSAFAQCRRRRSEKHVAMGCVRKRVA